MRIPKAIKEVLIDAVKSSFGDVDIVLFGSRMDDSKRGGDFDLAIMETFSKEAFRHHKVAFFRYLFQKGLDLPIDLVQYELASELLKREIDKGISLLKTADKINME